MTPELLPDVRAALEWYSAAAVRTMARNRSERGREARSKSDCIALLKSTLFDASSIRQAIASLNPVAAEGLALLKQRGGSMPVAALVGQVAVWHPELAPDSVHAIPTELIGRALAFWHAPSSRYGNPSVHDLRRPATDNLHSALIYSPPEVLNFVAPPARRPRPLNPLAPGGANEGEILWQRRLMAFLRSIETRKPKVLQSGQLGVRDREAIGAALGMARGTEEVKIGEGLSFRFQPIAFLRAVLGAAGLLEVSGDRVLRTTPEALHFISHPPSRQAEILLDAWLRSGESELFWLAHLKCDRRASSPTSVPDDERVGRARAFLLDLIREAVVPGYRYDLAEFVRLARWRDVEFLVSWRDPAPYRWSSYYYDRDPLIQPVYAGITLEDARGRSRSLTMGQDWDLVEGAYIRAVFEGPLSWLGIVDAEPYGNGDLSFALTSLGARTLGIEGGPRQDAETVAPAVADALIVQPNFDILIYDPDDRLELLFQIDRFAERVSVDRVALYRLTRDSLCSGLQLGLKVEDVVGVLEGAARAPLPQNVEVSLRDWARQFEEVRWLRNAWLLEAPDAANLDRWLALPELASALDRRVSSTVALLTGGRPPDLPGLLRGQGVEVRVVDASEPLTPSVYISNDGLVQTPEVDAHIYLRDALSRVAELLPDQSEHVTFRVTPSSVARARRSGQGAADVLATFEKASRWSLPPGFVVRVKGWAGVYAPVALGPVGYFVAPDSESFRELRVDPELADLFLEDVSPVSAIVRLEALETLNLALADRGVATTVYQPPPRSSKSPPNQNGLNGNEEFGRPVVRHDPARTRQILDRAIATHQHVLVEYRAAGGSALSRYVLQPIEIRERGGNPILHGFCPTREGFRDFTLANIVGVGLIAEASRR